MGFKLNLSVIKSALAATCFINAAKEKLSIPVYIPEIEAVLQRGAELSAEELQLDAESLKKFVGLYCQVSRKIQEFLRESSKDQYQFSEAEFQMLASVKKNIPQLHLTQSLAEVHQTLEVGSDDIAKQVLAWARALIMDTNTQLYNAIKEAADDGSLSNTEELRLQMENLLAEIFLDETINASVKTLVDSWAVSLSECHILHSTTFTM